MIIIYMLQARDILFDQNDKFINLKKCNFYISLFYDVYPF